MAVNSKEHKYSKAKRRIDILGLATFVTSSIVFTLLIAWVFSRAWTEGWVLLSGLSLGFVISLVTSIAMSYALDKEYDRVSLSLWAYALIRFRFLLPMFLIPIAISLLIVFFFSKTSYRERDPFLLLPRTLIFIALVLFSGYVFPFLFSRVTGAKEIKRKELSLIVDEVSKQVGINVQGIYEVPLKGLRTANAAQVGFIQGRRSVFLLGEWDKLFTKDEIRAVLAHEFVHAKHDHIRKKISVQAFGFVGVPSLIFLFTDLFIRILDIPIPAPTWVAFVLVCFATILVGGTILFAQWLSRRYEFEADLEAAIVCGSAPLISALVKLAELNMIPKGRSNLLSTHPSIEDRVRSLEDLNRSKGDLG